MEAEELTRRLEAADRARAALRRTTVEWTELGKQLLAGREAGPDRSDDRDARRR